jgi:aminoglycoside phosphotransferase (APT) family kinase protein
MDEALAEFLSSATGHRVEVRGIQRIAVGHSRAMYRVDCEDFAHKCVGPFVVRMEQGGVFGTSSLEEFGVMRALANAGIPVANVLWMEPTGSVLGQPFFVMDFLVAGGVGDERAMDESSANEFIGELRKLHQLDALSLSMPFALIPDTPNQATHLQIDRWAEIYRSSSPVPVPLLEEAAAWLHAFAPPLERIAIVHGDAGPGNVVVADGRIVAITDFEFTHLGDPAEDWAFCVAMRGARTMRRDAWIELLGAHGVSLTPWEWTYWEAFNLFKGACANLTCFHLFETGVNRAPNMAIIGTTLHQVFLRRLVNIVENHSAHPQVQPIAETEKLRTIYGS